MELRGIKKEEGRINRHMYAIGCAFLLVIILTLSGIASQTEWNLVLDEDFTEPTASWEIVETKEVRWGFSPKAYTVEILNPFRETAVEVPRSRDLFDFIMEMDVSVAAGSGWFGIRFRYDLSKNMSYLIQFSSDGRWRFSVWPVTGDSSVLQDWTYIPGFCTRKTNHFRIIAHGPSIQIYVNEVFLKDITDESLRKGLIDLVAGSYNEVPFQVNFHYFRLFKAYRVRELATSAEESLRRAESALHGGAFTYAVTEFQVAAYLFQKVHWKEKQAFAKSKEAFCWIMLGAYSMAIKRFAEALSLCHLVGPLPMALYIMADCFLGMGDAYYSLGDYQQAMSYYYQALACYKKLPYAGGVVNALAGLRKCFYAFGNYEAAIYYFGSGIPVYSETDYRDPKYQEGQAWSFLIIGKSYYELGAYVKAISKYEDALYGFRYARCFYGEALTLIFIGDAYVALEEYEKALEYYEDAKKVMQRIPPPPGIEIKTGDLEAFWRASNGLARCYLAHGEQDQAVAELELAITAVETMRGWIGNPFSRTPFMHEKRFLYQNVVPVLLKTGKIQKGVFYAERAKARTLLDMMETAMRVSPEKLPVDLRTGANLIRQISALQFNVIFGALFGQEAININFQDTIYDLHKKYKAFLSSLETENPKMPMLLTVNPDQIKDYTAYVQSNLGPGTVALEYFVTDDETIVWVITQDGIQTASRIAISKDDLTEQVRGFREEIESPPALDEEAISYLSALEKGRDLYELLIAPVEEYLEGAEHLVIIPSDVLFYLPFGALVNCPDCEQRDLYGGEFLIENYSISYAPSMSSLYWPFQHRSNGTYKSILAVGNPTGNLPASEEEVKKAAALFPQSTVLIGAQATEAAVKESLQTASYDVIHLSTHGLFDTKMPLLSELVFRKGGNDDGNLYAGEILGLSLTTNLVVLSACQTALPPELTEETEGIVVGDELQGLSQALFVAGAPTAVLTLWNVNDKSTSQLMQTMYKGLMEGDSKGEALRQAQLSLLHNATYRHPCYWAPFVLYGDWR